MELKCEGNCQGVSKHDCVVDWGRISIFKLTEMDLDASGSLETC
jgi:hypothetical protein